jgi:radical SAM superfamily enzyme YgiQ (UPF0313 family)
MAKDSMARSGQDPRALRQSETWLISPGGGAGLKAGLVFPSPYFVGMSNLGFHVVYRILASRPEVLAERLFYQGPVDFPRSIESGRAAADFDLLAFSCAYEPDYLNLIRFLRQGRIEPLARNRTDSDPLLIAGGIAVTANPAPLSRIMDAFLLGDGEEVLPEAMDTLAEFDLRSTPRERVLEALSRIPGAYIPSIHGEQLERDFVVRRVKELSAYPSGNAILTPHTELSGVFLAEVARGCVRGCQFCLVGHFMSRLRLRKIDRIVAQVEELRPHLSKVGLVASEIACHPGIPDLCEYLVAQGLEISTSSLEIDRLDRRLIELLIRGGQKTLTPCSRIRDESLRFGLHKRIPDEKIFDLAALAGEAGVERIKLYIILGMPHSGEEEVESLVRFLARFRDLFFAAGGRGRKEIVCSVNPFVPKPHTPWAWEAMLPESEFKKRILQVRRDAGKIGGIRIASWSPAAAALDAMLSSGNAETGEILVDALDQDASIRPLVQRLRSEGPVDPYLSRRDLPLPWAHIQDTDFSDQSESSSENGPYHQTVPKH